MKPTITLAVLCTATSLGMAGGMAFAKDQSTMHSGTMQKSAMQSSSMSGDQSMSGNAPMVGGAPMYPSNTIVENASKANNLTTLVAAVKEAGLVDTLSGKGPFTVFAPTDSAFSKLPKSTVDSLMKPSNQAQLKKILTYHVVPGDITARTLQADLKKGHGTATFKTVEGGTIKISEKGGKMWLTDHKGDRAQIEQQDVKQSNGTVYVIGSVLQPA